MKESNPITYAAQITQQYIEMLSEILNQPENNSILLQADADAKRILNRLNFLSGSAPVTEDLQTKADMFPPVTDFMGEKIEKQRDLTKEDLTPKELEKETFRQRVDQLYKQFSTIEPQGILNSHTTPEYQMVLRGVAKLAGVEGYETRELNLKLIEDITAGIAASAANASLDGALEEDLKKTRDGAPDMNSTDHTLTEEDFVTNPDLEAQGLKVGDVIQIPGMSGAAAEQAANAANASVSNPGTTDTSVANVPANEVIKEVTGKNAPKKTGK